MLDCDKAAEVGAHVYILNEKSNKVYYILPACRTCNSSGSDSGSDSIHLCKYGKGWCNVKDKAYAVAAELKAEYVLEDGHRKKA